jgi:ubiquitin C-terminal hydrolase
MPDNLQSQHLSSTNQTVAQTTSAVSDQAVADENKPASPPFNAVPKLWTGLFNPAAATITKATNGARQGSGATATANASFGKTNAESLAEALHSFRAISKDSKLSFLEPRGLVNTGNMCYMNSVSLLDLKFLQIRTNSPSGPASFGFLRAIL